MFAKHVWCVGSCVPLGFCLVPRKYDDMIEWVFALRTIYYLHVHVQDEYLVCFLDPSHNRLLATMDNALKIISLASISPRDIREHSCLPQHLVGFLFQKDSTGNTACKTNLDSYGKDKIFKYFLDSVFPLLPICQSYTTLSKVFHTSSWMTLPFAIHQPCTFAMRMADHLHNLLQLLRVQRN